MLRGVWLAIVSGLLIFPALLRGQEQYQIRLTPPGKGAETTDEVDSRFRVAAEKWDVAGKPITDDLSIFGFKTLYHSTILEMKGDTVTRLRRHYDRAISVANGNEVAEPVQGKTILILENQARKKMVLTEKGEPLPADLVARLEAQTKQAGQCLAEAESIAPKKAVRVGESWLIDAVSWAKRDDAELTLTRANGQLTKVYKKGNRLFGVIECRAEFQIKSMLVSGRKLMMQPGARIVMKSSTDACIDGSSWESVEHCEFLLTAVVRAPGPDGLDTKMDQEIFIRAMQSTR